MLKRLLLLLAAVLLLAAPAHAVCNVPICKEQGGARMTIGSGGSLDVESGGELDVESGGAIKIGGTALTSSAAQFNVLTTLTSTAAELNLLDTSTTTAAQHNALNGGAVFDTVITCGQADESGTIYLGPALGQWDGTGTDSSIGGTACDALDDGTEGTADLPLALVADVAFKFLGALCVTDGTLASGESVIFTARSAAADLTPSATCTIGEAETSCSMVIAATTNIAAGATIATKAVQAGNNSDDNLWCKWTIAYQ